MTRRKSAPDDYVERKVESGADGAYAVGGLRSSTYEMRVCARGGLDADAAKVVLARGVAAGRADFTLSRGVTLRGSVVDEAGTAISGAEVHAEGVERPGSAGTRTDAEGKFAIAGLDGRSSYDVRAWARGFRSTGLALSVPRDGVVFAFVRAPPPATVAGQVRAPGVASLPEGHVSVDGPGLDTVTDHTGRFKLETEGGVLRLRFRVPGYRVETREVTVSPSETLDGLVVDLTRASAIAGRVVAAHSGLPVRDAYLRVRFPEVRDSFRDSVDDWSDVYDVQRGGNGDFLIEDLPVGSVEIEAHGGSQRDQLASARVSCVVVPGETTHVRIALPRMGVVRGKVLRGGEGAAGYLVMADGQWSTKDEACIRTDEDGAFLLPCVEPGEREVYVYKDPVEGYLAKARVAVPAGGVADVTITLACVHVSGRVTARGEGVGPVCLSFSGAASWQCEVWVDDEGGFTFDAPGPGLYDDVVNVFGERFATSIRIPAGVDSCRTDIALPEGGLAVTVLDGEDGKPVEQLMVFVLPEGAGALPALEFFRAIVCLHQTFLFDDSGCVEVGMLASGRYSILVQAPGYASAWIDSVEVAEGSRRVGAQIALARETRCRLEVANAEGKEVESPRAIVRDSRGRYLTASSDSCENGLMIDGITPGTYRVTVGSREHATVTARMRLAADGPVPRLVLQEGGALAVEVVDAIYVLGYLLSRQNPVGACPGSLGKLARHGSDERCELIGQIRHGLELPGDAHR